MTDRTGSTIAEVVAILTLSTLSFLAQAQNLGTHYEVGVVYYADEGVFKPLKREVAQEGGHSNYSAKVNGAHATIRLRTNQPMVFRICNVDPSRFKPYRFMSKGNARTLTIAKINMWIGGSKTVVSESEIPVTINSVESGCFALTPQQALDDGEYGFSPDGSLDVFMFGVGDPKQSK
jgi:hypothetical protein